MPTGAEVTEPPPLPALVTFSEKRPRSKLAPTALSLSTMTTQSPVPVQSPDQPPKDEAPVGVAPRVSSVPQATSTEHAVAPSPQSIVVPSEDWTTPVPSPPTLTSTVKVSRSKLAVTVVATSNVTMHESVPVQPPPLHPVKTEPPPATAERVTTVSMA